MKILIIGLGSIAGKHINALRRIDKSIEILALRSSVGKGQDLDGVKNLYSFEEIPDDFTFSIISNPTSLHAGSILRMIPYGKPIFVEKPVLSSMQDADEISSLLSKNKIISYTACNMRFHPAIEFLKSEILHKPPLEYTSYCGSYLPGWRPGTDYRNSYSAKKDLGGGVHLDLIHEIDYCRYLLGSPMRIQSSMAKRSNLDIDSLDSARYMLDFENTAATITLNYFRINTKRSIECIWNDKIWNIDLLKNEIIENEQTVIYSEKYGIEDTYYKQLSYFIDCLDREIQPMNSIAEGIQTLKLCLNE